MRNIDYVNAQAMLTKRGYRFYYIMPKVNSTQTKFGECWAKDDGNDSVCWLNNDTVKAILKAGYPK